jgi:hypothetical protein
MLFHGSLRWPSPVFCRGLTVGARANNRYLGTLATLVETRTVRALTEPLTRRVPEPARRKKVAAPRYVRGLNPLKAEDAGLLAALDSEPAQDDTETRRRSSHVTRLLRILRAHGLLEKIPGTHRYQIDPEARTKVQNLLALCNANTNQLTRNAA